MVLNKPLHRIKYILQAQHIREWLIIACLRHSSVLGQKMYLRLESTWFEAHNQFYLWNHSSILYLCCTYVDLHSYLQFSFTCMVSVRSIYINSSVLICTYISWLYSHHRQYCCKHVPNNCHLGQKYLVNVMPAFSCSQAMTHHNSLHLNTDCWQ